MLPKSHTPPKVPICGGSCQALWRDTQRFRPADDTDTSRGRRTSSRLPIALSTRKLQSCARWLIKMVSRCPRLAPGGVIGNLLVMARKTRPTQRPIARRPPLDSDERTRSVATATPPFLSLSSTPAADREAALPAAAIVKIAIASDIPSMGRSVASALPHRLNTLAVSNRVCSISAP